MAYCFQCGCQVPDGAPACPQCGAVMQRPGGAGSGNPSMSDPGMQPMQQPVTNPGMRPMQQSMPNPGMRPMQQSMPNPGMQPMQQPMPNPGMQYPHQAGGMQMNHPMGNGQMNNYPMGGPNGMGGPGGPGGPGGKHSKKYRKWMIIGIISASVAVIALLVILFLWPGVLRNKDEDGKTSADSSTEQDPMGLNGTEKDIFDLTEVLTEDETDADTEEETEPITETETEAPFTATEEIQAATEKATEKDTEKNTEKETGDPNDKSFKKYGMKTNLEQGKKKTVTTASGSTASVEWTNYEVNPVSEGIIDFGNENNMKLSGYEHKTATSEIDFDDASSFDEEGAELQPWMTDWYNVDLFEDSLEKKVDSYDEEYYRGKITVDGTRKWVYIWYLYDYQDGNDKHLTVTFTILAPAGYDGVVVGVSGSGEQKKDKKDKKTYLVYDKAKFAWLYMM